MVFFWCPGAYSEAPGAVDLAFGSCICWPGAYCEAPGSFLSVCAKADVAATRAPITTIAFIMAQIILKILRSFPTFDDEGRSKPPVWPVEIGFVAPKFADI